VRFCWYLGVRVSADGASCISYTVTNTNAGTETVEYTDCCFGNTGIQVPTNESRTFCALKDSVNAADGVVIESNCLCTGSSGTSGTAGSSGTSGSPLDLTPTFIAGESLTPLSGTFDSGITSVLSNLQDWGTSYFSGELLLQEISGEAINFGQVCYRDRYGKWSKAVGSSAADTAYNMLGICVHTVGAANADTSILTRGYVSVPAAYLGGNETGEPLYLSDSTAGSITFTVPTSAGRVVRLIGYTFWDSSHHAGSKWILFFNPDNTWIEL
jgi:hypothetical protein